MFEWQKHTQSLNEVTPYDISDIPMPDAPLIGESSDIIANSDIPMPSALGPEE